MSPSIRLRLIGGCVCLLLAGAAFYGWVLRSHQVANALPGTTVSLQSYLWLMHVAAVSKFAAVMLLGTAAMDWVGPWFRSLLKHHSEDRDAALRE